MDVKLCINKVPIQPAENTKYLGIIIMIILIVLYIVITITNTVV